METLAATLPFREIAETALLALPKAQIGLAGFPEHNLRISFDHANVEAVHAAIKSLAQQVKALKPQGYFSAEISVGVEYGYIAQDAHRIVRISRFWDGSHVLTHLDVYFS